MTTRVYKYLSARYAIDDLKRRRVKVAKVDELNDPFDLAPIDTTHPAVEQAVNETVASFKVDTGLLCFSRVWDNILLWSHYGDCHTGICLGFDMPGDSSEAGYHMEVCYQPNVLQIQKQSDVTDDLVNRLLRTKYEVWSYEQELRVFVKLNDPPDENGLLWFDFGPNLQLREVVMGVNFLPAHNTLVQQTIVNYEDPPKLYWAAMKKDAFVLTRLEEAPDWEALRRGAD
jgi:hypothetical protein